MGGGEGMNGKNGGERGEGEWKRGKGEGGGSVGSVDKRGALA